MRKHPFYPFRIILLISVVCFRFDSAHAETVKDREGAVRADASKMQDNERWIYNDIEAGFAEAEKSGKPLMVVLRCVPCLACMGLDAELLMENQGLQPLMDQFVRVRVINANALDLSLFQFDYDLSLSVMFFHPDRTVYGRFGSWEHQKDKQNKAAEGLRFAMQRALALHSDKDRYQKALSGKKGEPFAYKTPVDMPELKSRFRRELDWEGAVVKSCVHCHQIGDAIRSEHRDRGDLIPQRWIAPYPSPEVVGLVFKETPVTEVDRVIPGSAAEKAGFQRGDQILFLEDQPLISIADVTWVLHNADDRDELKAKVLRKGKTGELNLTLEPGWRLDYDSSRRVAIWPMRGMALGGMKLEPVDPSEKKRLGIDEDRLALKAIHVGKYNKHGAARRAGFRPDDILVEVAGSDQPHNEISLIASNLKSKPGTSIDVTVLRNRQRIPLQLPIQ